MKPSNARITLGVSLLALCGLAAAASITPEPVYNPSAEIRMSAVITGVHQVPAGSPMAGVHLTVQAKTGTADVYLGPAEFIKIFKTSFPAGAPIQIVGSRVAGAGGEVILAREVSEGATSITLRELTGVPVWEHWGVVADTAVSGG
jgi:hypothetical protein